MHDFIFADRAQWDISIYQQVHCSLAGFTFLAGVPFFIDNDPDVNAAFFCINQGFYYHGRGKGICHHPDRLPGLFDGIQYDLLSGAFRRETDLDGGGRHGTGRQ